MIDIRNLEFAYESLEFRIHVEKLMIADGERVAWTGPSGSGKTTLLQLVAGNLRPSAGDIISCGQNISELSDTARRNFRIANVGLVFQEFELLDYLSVLDNILLAYHINRSLSLTFDIRMRAQKLAATLGIAHLVSRRPARLSQGERQRVAVCRALITNPKLVLADEPIANLDSDNADRVLKAFDSHVQESNATLVVATHDQTILSRFDRTVDIAAYRRSADGYETPKSSNRNH